MGKNVHIKKGAGGSNWIVKKEGAMKASIRTSSQSEAIKMGRIISQKSKGELLIHEKDEAVDERLR